MKPLEVPPPGGHGATLEQRRAAEAQMEKDARRLPGNTQGRLEAYARDSGNATKELINTNEGAAE